MPLSCKTRRAAAARSASGNTVKVKGSYCGVEPNLLKSENLSTQIYADERRLFRGGEESIEQV